MRDFRDAKTMAQTLREALQAKSISLTHSESLELVAKLFGFRDWNVLSARIEAEGQPKILIPGPGIPAIGRPLVAPEGHLPTVPLRDLVFFPMMIAPLFVGRDTTKRALECAMAGDRRILALTQRHAGDDNPGRDALYEVGVIASVVELVPLGDGTIKLLARGLARATVTHLAEGPFWSAQTGAIEESQRSAEEAVVLARTVREKLKAVQMFNSASSLNFASSPYDRLLLIEEPAELADAVAPFIRCEINQRQELLETADVVVRLQKLLALMNSDQQAA